MLIRMRSLLFIAALALITGCSGLRKTQVPKSEPRTSEPIRMIPEIGHSRRIMARIGSIEEVLISRDGRLVLSGASDGSAKLWELPKGKLLGTFRPPGSTSFQGRSKVSNLAIAPHSGLVLLRSKDKSWLWNYHTREAPRELRGTCRWLSRDGTLVMCSHDKRLELRKTSDLTIWRTLRDLPEAPIQVILTDEPQVIAILDTKGAVTVQTLLDSTVRHFNAKGIHLDIDSSGQRIAILDQEGSVHVWNQATDKKEYRGHLEGAQVVSLADNGVITLGKPTQITQFDQSGHTLNYKIKDGEEKSLITLSSDGSRAIIGGNPASLTLKLWQRTEESEIHEFAYEAQWVSGVAVSPDGIHALTTRANIRLGLAFVLEWNLEELSFKHHLMGAVKGIPRVMYSSNGDAAIVGDIPPGVGGESSGVRFDLKSRRQTQKLGQVSIQQSLRSADGIREVRHDQSTTAQVIDTVTGASIATIALPDLTFPLALSPNGEWLAGGTWFSQIHLWNIDSGESRILSGHNDMLLSLVFTPDSKQLLSGAADGIARLWNVDNGDSVMLLSSSSPYPVNDWLVASDDGYFDSSSGTLLASAVQSGQSFSLEQIAIQNNRPDLLLERMRRGSYTLIKHFRTRYQNRLRRRGITDRSIQTNTSISPPQIKIRDIQTNGMYSQLRFSISASAYPLKYCNIYVNAVPVYGLEGLPCEGRQYEKTLVIPLTEGNNHIEVAAMDTTGMEGLRPSRDIKLQQSVESKIYFIGFGVSDYQDDRLDLSYAHKDAQDLSSAFRDISGVKKVYTKIYINEKVNQDAFKEAESILRGSDIHDTVIVFIAGHGMYAGDGFSEYFFLPNDVDLERVSDTGISFSRVEKLLAVAGARRRLLLIDTCESGERDEHESAILEKQTQKKLYPRGALRLASVKQERPLSMMRSKNRYIYRDIARESGTIVLTSSSGTEYSYEREDLKNGVFTAALLNGLKSTESDKDGDGWIQLSELGEIIKRDVALLSNGRQHPSIDSQRLSQEISLPILGL